MSSFGSLDADGQHVTAAQAAAAGGGNWVNENEAERFESDVSDGGGIEPDPMVNAELAGAFPGTAVTKRSGKAPDWVRPPVSPPVTTSTHRVKRPRASSTGEKIEAMLPKILKPVVRRLAAMTSPSKPRVNEGDILCTPHRSTNDSTGTDTVNGAMAPRRISSKFLESAVTEFDESDSDDGGIEPVRRSTPAHVLLFSLPLRH